MHLNFRKSKFKWFVTKNTGLNYSPVKINSPTKKNCPYFQNYAVSMRIVVLVIYYIEVLSEYAKTKKKIGDLEKMDLLEIRITGSAFKNTRNE